MADEWCFVELAGATFGIATKDGLTRVAAVPMFYFHLHNDLDVPDSEGADLADLETAIVRASCQARALVCEVTKEMAALISVIASTSRMAAASC